MSRLIFAGCILVSYTVLTPSASAQVRDSADDSAASIAPYKFEQGARNFADVLTLKDGTKRIGKVVEWGTNVLVYDPAGQAESFPVAAVEQFEFRRFLRHSAQPMHCDLTVAYVERTPRDPSWQGHVSVKDGVSILDAAAKSGAATIADGTSVTYRIHVLNAGKQSSPPVSCRVSVDGESLRAPGIPMLRPGAEFVAEAPWKWKSSANQLKIELDSDGKTPEIARWNNTFVEPVRGQGLTVVVPKSRQEIFSKRPNMVDTCNLADYVQFHIRILNRLFAESKYPSSPKGILERVRCERIMLVESVDDPDERDRWTKELHGDIGAGLVTIHDEDPYRPDIYEPLRVNWRLLQDMGRQLGLIDLGATDTTIEQCMVLNHYERYANLQYLFAQPQSLMYSAGAFPLSEQCAGYLNHRRGMPRGCPGQYLWQTPEKITLEVRSGSGRPLENVQVDVFQLQNEGAEAGYILGFGHGDPIFAATTDASGRLTLLNREVPKVESPEGYSLRPNPFGKIATDGSNALLLLRLRQGAEEAFEFLPLFDCNVACLRGQTGEYVRTIQTRFANPNGPPMPPYSAAFMEVRPPPNGMADITWGRVSGNAGKPIDEYRVYKRNSLEGEESHPWQLASIIRRKPEGWVAQAQSTFFDRATAGLLSSLDTFYAVSAIDGSGAEGPLSPPSYLAWEKNSPRIALEGDNAYITLRGKGPMQMLHWDGSVGTQPYGVRLMAFKGYHPGFAGVAIGSDHQIIVADPVNHVIAFYESGGDLATVIPKRDYWPGFASNEEGEFNEPSDVAVGPGGDIYVADKGNNRVQVLDMTGKYKATLDAPFHFEGPSALACSNNHLCVTDRSGTRCRVYDVGPTPKFVRELPFLMDADRAFVGRKGDVYVLGQPDGKSKDGLAVFKPDGVSAKLDHVEVEGEMGKFYHPRGGCFFVDGAGDDYIYMVNELPFDVRRFRIE